MAVLTHAARGSHLGFVQGPARRKHPQTAVGRSFWRLSSDEQAALLAILSSPASRTITLPWQALASWSHHHLPALGSRSEQASPEFASSYHDRTLRPTRETNATQPWPPNQDRRRPTSAPCG